MAIGRIIRFQPSFGVALLPAVFAACGENAVGVQYPELHGTYIGEFGIEAIYSGGAPRRLFVCGGPGSITIASTRRGEVDGSWSFGPNTAVAGPPDPTSGQQERTCGENWLRQGEVGGEVLSEFGVLSLSFFYEGTDLISGAFGDEYLGGPRNSWRTGVALDSLWVRRAAWDNAPRFYGGRYFITFQGSR